MSSARKEEEELKPECDGARGKKIGVIGGGNPREVRSREKAVFISLRGGSGILDTNYSCAHAASTSHEKVHLQLEDDVETDAGWRRRAA